MPLITSQRAEIVRYRDDAGGRTWRIDITTTDDRGFVTRTTVAERDDKRTIIADAFELERHGTRVDRGGLA